MAAGFFQNTAEVRADGVWRNAAIGGNVFYGFSGGEAAGDARLGGRQTSGRNQLSGSGGA
jgi:hypothetical protein